MPPSPNKAAGMGCPAAGCTGYEIGAGSEDTALNVDLKIGSFNSDAGWLPIPGFAATFEGNGNTISGPYMSRTGNDNGLFGTVTSAGAIRNVGLTGVNVTGGNSTGGLVGSNAGAISGSYASGVVTTTGHTSGGLVGENTGTISASYAAVTLTVSGATVDQRYGGLVGYNSGGTISASYATGDVIGTSNTAFAGGLVGTNQGVVRASYATGDVSGKDTLGGLVGNQNLVGTITASFSTGRVSGTGSAGISGLVGISSGTVTASYWDTTASGLSTSSGGTGKTTGELQTPTAYGTSPSIYADWNLNLDGVAGGDDPWDFGGSANYPALKYGGLSPWASHQALLTATPGGRRVTLNWNPGAYGDRPADMTQWQYRQKEGAGAYGAWQSAVGGVALSTEHVVTGLTGGTSYTFQVRAANTGGRRLRTGEHGGVGDAIDVRTSGATHRTDRNARQPRGYAALGRRDRRRRRGHHPLGLPLQHGRYAGRLAGQR